MHNQKRILNISDYIMPYDHNIQTSNVWHFRFKHTFKIQLYLIVKRKAEMQRLEDINSISPAVIQSFKSRLDRQTYETKLSKYSNRRNIHGPLAPVSTLHTYTILCKHLEMKTFQENLPKHRSESI